MTIAYVPIGRCQSLLDITDVRWVRLPPCFEPASHPRLPFHAVVADLADSSLTAQWEQLLAETALQGTPVYQCAASARVADWPIAYQTPL